MRTIPVRYVALVTVAVLLAGSCTSSDPVSETAPPGESVPDQQQGPPRGYEEVPLGVATEITLGGGTLRIPEAAYDDTTAIRMTQRPQSPLPTTTSLHQLISAPVELDLDGYATQLEPLELTLEFDPASLPDGADPGAITIVWWDGQAWQDVPTTVDIEAGQVTAEIHHFSTFAVALSRLAKVLGDGGYFQERALYPPFTIYYTARSPSQQGGFWPWSTAAGDDRPSLTDEDGDSIPDYIERMGADLAAARDRFDSLLWGYDSANVANLGQFSDLRSVPDDEGPIDVYVADIEPAAGFYRHNYNADRGVLILDNDLYSATTVAHELFHAIQYSLRPAWVVDKHRWWAEATAEWAADWAFEDTNDYYSFVRESKPNPAYEGYAGLASRSYGEYYAAVSLVQYLDMRNPGFVMDTLAPTWQREIPGLLYGESWFEGLDRILGSRGTTIEEVMDDYFVSYFYHWDFDPEMPAVLDIGEPALLADPLLVADPGTYRRIAHTLPPVSGRLVTIEGGSSVDEANLVIRLGKSAFVNVFADTVTGGQRTRADLPGSADREGVILGVDGESIVVEDFGGAQSGQPVNQVHLVASNALPRSDISLELEVYLLEAPEDLILDDSTEGTTRLTWTPTGLPIGEDETDDGALTGYRLYRQIGDDEPELVAEIDASATSHEIDSELLAPDRVALFLRSVDKYGNESPESDRVPSEPSLALTASTVQESSCFVSSVNDWQFCDITASLTLAYTASVTPATIRCVLASSEEAAAVEVTEISGSIQLTITDTAVNMENRATFPVLGCNLEPGGIRFSLPYGFGTFVPPDQQ
jgi:hypothetical protein